jgi:hypothetical protein
MTQVNRVAGSPGRKISQPVLDRVLVGVDFRQPSLAAARWAATHLGHRTRLALAHVQTVPEVPGFLQPMMPVLDDRLVARFGSPPPRSAWFCGDARSHGPVGACARRTYRPESD